MSRNVWSIGVFLVLTLGAARAMPESPSTVLTPTGSSSAVAPSSASLSIIPLERTLSMGEMDASAGAVIRSSAVRAQVQERLSTTVSDDYFIGAEDVLEVTVWRNLDLSKLVQVRPDGRISLPIVRDIVAVGKTPVQLADEISTRLKEYVQNPIVAISVKEVNSYSVFLIGEVVRPGRYPLKGRVTLLQGLTIAGGFTPVAARNQVVVFRTGENGKGEQMLRASYDDIVLLGGISQNIELKAGDTVVVPSESMVTLPGNSKREEFSRNN